MDPEWEYLLSFNSIVNTVLVLSLFQDLPPQVPGLNGSLHLDLCILCFNSHVERRLGEFRTGQEHWILFHTEGPEW